MAFDKTSKLQGDEQSYTISDGIKKFSLRDVGFNESKNGNFTLKRSLDPSSPYNATVELKVMVNSDLSGFKMAAVAGNGMREVNIFKMERKDAFLEQFHYIMDNLEEREIIVPVTH
ncbi:DUF1831 domain-containing protein [Secundilactobacillus silagei]|uniref:Cysteine desulfurase n=1 Tax=Secundilactobacillus silagei JCM 19001 TaxID=1302250 RepID=A0A1Z5IJJ3_9LACO|nr:DUF1831 domain-containing protein [Secundilactobacillus silagei]TDG68702.1 hypothetical protein C5L25_001778 [Secundilactobacillus silagei JCM 19001]GAX01849.1 cysteine desulfurase [Secundilactobacillus silagei JCM 19001]